MYATDSKSLRTAIAAIIATGLLQAAHALGLGPITVNSHIGEPLRATINVTGLDSVKGAGPTIGIADSAAYASRGIKKLPSHDQLSLALKSGAHGHYIDISTPNVVREPFITFVLSLNHDGKETLREYTVFLDPAADGLVSPVVPLQNIPEAGTARVAEVSQPELLTNQPASPVAVGWKGMPAKVAAPGRAAPATMDWQGKSYGPVQKGETLFSIAEKVRPSPDYSIQTVMRQIYRANHRAFKNNQLNSLMAGYTLSIPVFTKELVPQPSRVEKAASPGTGKAKDTEKNEASQNSVVPESVATANDAVMEDSSRDNEAVNEAITTEVAVPNSEESEGVGSADILAQELPEDETDTDSIDVSDTAIENTQPLGDLPSDELDETIGLETRPDEQQNGDGLDSVAVVEQSETQIAESAGSVEHTEENIEFNNMPAVPDATTTEQPSEVVVPETPAEDTASAPSSSDTGNSELIVEEQPIVTTEPVNESFWNTKYGFLVVWQWLALGGLLLGLLALLLFKQRQKHAVDEFDALDDAEMDAVLAKINSFEDDGHESSELNSSDTWLEKQQDDNFEGAMEEPSFDDDTFAEKNGESIFDDFDAHMSHEQGMDASQEDLHDFESDPDLFFNEDEVQDLQQDASEIEQSEDDNFDFFMEDDLSSKPSQDAVDWQNDVTPASQEHQDIENHDDETDFFNADEIDDEDVLQFSDEQSFSENSNRYIDQTDDFGDLFAGEDDHANESNFGIHHADESVDSDVEASAFAPQNRDELIEENVGESIAANSEEMEINLDLATSFIATGHGERAVSWLEEVLEAGTDTQKARAQTLLDKVRGT